MSYEEGPGWIKINGQYGVDIVRQQNEAIAREQRGGEGPHPIGPVDPADRGQESLLYPIFILGVAAYILFHFGLLQSMFTSIPAFIKASLVLGFAIFFLTKKGIALAQMLLFLGIVCAVSIGVAMFIGFKLGLIKPTAFPVHTGHAAHIRHHLATGSTH